MADGVYPSVKSNANGTTKAAAPTPGGKSGSQTLSANTAQPHNATRPQPRTRRRGGRSCCCCCCLWTILAVIIILVLVTIAGAILWVLYRPRHPSFSVSDLQVSRFSITPSAQLNSRFNLTISARNPNNRISFSYDPMAVSLTSNDIDVGDGTLTGFDHETKNTTILRTLISANGGETLDSSAVNALQSNTRNKDGLPLKIQVDTNVQVMIGGLKTKKVPIRVLCDGLRAGVPTGRMSATATITDSKCKVDLRIKIWKWTF